MKVGTSTIDTKGLLESRTCLNEWRGCRFRHQVLYPHIHSMWSQFDWKEWNDTLLYASKKLPSVEEYKKYLADQESQGTKPK